MKLKIPAGVASSQDLTTLIIELREYARWFAHESIKKRVDAKHPSDAPAMSVAAMEILREWKSTQQINSKSLELLLTTLEDYIKSAPSITITLADVPTNVLKTTIVNWCRDNLSANVLVTFRFNATLLGGMVVSFGSRIFDWSFRRQILAAREKFPEVLRRV